MVDVWEACDRHGLIERWLPEWGRVRSLPQRNAVHRFTVDRHLVEAAAAAAAHTRRVSRPDLLLLGALLHDIGKGLPGDHSVVGARIADRIAYRWGMSDADRAILVCMVRWHLLLSDTATRRDLDDPATLHTVAEAVEQSHDVLDLLHALTEADAAATGPAAWSSWKARLIGDLVRRTHTLLGEGSPPPVRPLADSLAVSLGLDPASLGSDCVVRIEGDQVIVIAPGDVDLLSATAGVLALHRLDVYAADAAEFGEKATAVVLRAAPRFGSPPDSGLLAADLRRAVRGGLHVGEQLSRREASDAVTIPAPPPRVLWLHDVATDATVLELRAADRRGLLYRVTAALESVSAPVRAARVSTFGADAVDAFYLVGGYQDPARRAEVERAVLAAATAAQIVTQG
jgi:[protein-PII] uridylyltransferase